MSFSGDVINWNQTASAGTTTARSYKLSLGSGANSFIDYSLNIANNTDSRTEVLARPSITVLEGETGEFFLGEEVTYSSAGNDVDTYEKEVGITFEVTPELVDLGKVRLEARAEFDTFTSVDPGVVFTNKFATLKNKLSSTAILELGQTLVLGGGTEEGKSKSRDSTPFLGDIPILQTFFNRSVSTKTFTSLIFLITPRLAETIDDAVTLENAIGDQYGVGEEAIMGQLRKRFRTWFNPTSNLTKALLGLSNSELYREFRNGDLHFSDEDEDGKFDHLLDNDGYLFLNTYEEGFGAELLRYFYFD